MKQITKAALEWADDGIPVFPCASNKRPITSEGFYDASLDPTQIKQMFELAPDDCMIGARMGADSGLFACDFDIYKDGEAGVEAQKFMADLIASGILPDTQRHRTMNGGLHLIFQSDYGYPNCKPCKGVEIKGEGGYIILPPSRGYSIEDDSGFRKAPKALIDVLVAARKTHTNKTVDQHEAAIIAGQDFHDSITSIAAKMLRRGASAAEVFKKIHSALDASVARAVQHPRHDRWAALMRDDGGEISRIINSGRDKYDTSSKTNSARDNFSQEDIERAKKAAEKFGFSPSGGDTYEEPPKAEDYEGRWPFEGEGYFAGDELEISNQRFNIHPIYAENESFVIAADPKAGKTAISLKLAMHLAAGRSLGPFKITEPMGVIYYALEGTRAIKLRIEAEKRKAQDEGSPYPDNLPLFVVERPANFIHGRDQQIAKVVAASSFMDKEKGVRLGLVVVDTLTKAMPGSDQNSVDDTSSLFDFTSQLRAQGVNATVGYIHHTGKDGKTRGSSNIEAEVDVVLKMKKRDDGFTEMYVHMARSIDDNNRYLFELSSYDLGETLQGIRQTAPVVTLNEGNIGEDRTADDAKEAMLRTKFFTPLLGLGVGVHTMAIVVAAWKNANVLTGRVRASRIEEIMTGLFHNSLEQGFGGKRIVAAKDNSGKYVSIEVA